MTLNFQVNHEKRINETFKCLKSAGSLSDLRHKKIKAGGSKPGVLCGLCEVDKAIVDVCSPFRSILCSIRTPSFKIDKFLLPI